MTTPKPRAPADTDANRMYRRIVEKGRKYGLLLPGADPRNHVMMATPYAQHRIGIRGAVLKQCGIALTDRPSDVTADTVYAELADDARKHALVTSSYAGNVSIATPAAQRRDGTRGRVLTMHQMAEVRRTGVRVIQEIAIQAGVTDEATAEMKRRMDAYQIEKLIRDTQRDAGE